MSDNPMDKLNETMVNVRLDIRELSTKVDGMSDVKREVVQAGKVADEALDKSESAHHRINRIDKITFWAGTTIVGGVVIALLNMLWRSGGK
ncbi:hemolysin XhlA family protein [Paenibacillus sp. L3-i20]|uniref:hemolysin XhlA family protein n=1 Tax=Paenibacillus sp. L3-i20 TaxID=2905833 RepID=UPI001EE15317|nr:hemolysin XhlA family protein [Paenibacillus sp. L3-i20]GKU79845.1 hypothetical protein L3i20_v242420 [Paenibacillus sp. L3-i20]